ncbi:hypothetical protein ACFL2M_02055 [Patescibacteria group bacterium]
MEVNPDYIWVPTSTPSVTVEPATWNVCLYDTTSYAGEQEFTQMPGTCQILRLSAGDTRVYSFGFKKKAETWNPAVRKQAGATFGLAATGFDMWMEGGPVLHGNLGLVIERQYLKSGLFLQFEAGHIAPSTKSKNSSDSWDIALKPGLYGGDPRQRLEGEIHVGALGGLTHYTIGCDINPLEEEQGVNVLCGVPALEDQVYKNHLSATWGLIIGGGLRLGHFGIQLEGISRLVPARFVNLGDTVQIEVDDAYKSWPMTLTWPGTSMYLATGTSIKLIYWGG